MESASFALGCQLLEVGEAGEALPHLKLAAEEAPDNPVILEQLAVAYGVNEQLLPALKVYNRLIELGAATAAILRRAGLREWGNDRQAWRRADGSLSDGSYVELLATDPR